MKALSRLVSKENIKKMKDAHGHKSKLSANCVLIAKGEYGPPQEHHVVGVDYDEGVFFTALRHYFVDQNGKPDGSGMSMETLSMWSIDDAEPVPNTKTLWRMKNIKKEFDNESTGN